MLRLKNVENLSIVIIRSHQLALCQLTNESQCTFTLIKRAADCLNNITVVQGVCTDKTTVYADHVYDTKVYRDQAVQNIKQIQKNIRNHLHDELTLHAYEAHLSR